MAAHSSILAWKIPGREELGVGYSPWGRKESDTTEHARKFKIKYLKNSSRHRKWKKDQSVKIVIRHSYH